MGGVRKGGAGDTRWRAATTHLAACCHRRETTASFLSDVFILARTRRVWRSRRACLLNDGISILFNLVTSSRLQCSTELLLCVFRAQFSGKPQETVVLLHPKEV